MRSFVAIVGLVFVVNSLGFSGSETRYEPGVLTAEEPLQASTIALAFDFNGYKITPLADYKITGRVVARNSYWFGREAELSPTDLALAWGPVSDQAVIDDLKFSLSLRYLRWAASDLPLAREVIESHLANNHIIPANREVAMQLEQISEGQLVSLSGKLIKASSAEGADGWDWTSSLSRTDEGVDSGELLYVDKIEVLTATRRSLS